MKIYFTLFLSFCITFTLNAQIPNGSIARDFTTTDINGNTYNIYEILDQGKSVYLYLMNTNCVPCWEYHTTGTLDSLYDSYGPEGTDELIVIMIEPDPTTSLEDLDGTGSNTLGNWLADQSYPIVNADNFTNFYEVDSLPTLYHICPNRIINGTELGVVEELYQQATNCEGPEGQYNVNLTSANGIEGIYCEGTMVSPTISFQNLGTETVNEVEFELYKNGQLDQSLKIVDYDVSTFQFDIITFSDIIITENAEIEVRATTVNNNADQDQTNNSLTFDLILANQAATPFITLQIETDSYPSETYWEIIDENNFTVANGGNLDFSTGGIGRYTYTDQLTTYEHQIAIPNPGCYDLLIFDQAADGLCCGFGEGSYRLLDEDSNVMIEGGEFGFLERIPFEVLDAAGTIDNNARIIGYQGIEGKACGIINFTPRLAIQNIGNDTISSMQIATINQFGQTISAFDWTGSINSRAVEIVSLPELFVDSTLNFTYQIIEVNGEADVYGYQNQLNILVEKPPFTDRDTLNISIQTDEFGYELYWHIEDEDGFIVDFGGNTVVGPDGVNQQIATENDPGAYDNFALISEQVILPENGCYTLVLVDDFADGLEANGFFKIRDASGLELINITGIYGRLDEPIEFEMEPVSVNELTTVNRVELRPNPASHLTTLIFQLETAQLLDIEVNDLLGRVMHSVPVTQYVAGDHQLDLPLDRFSPGVYFVNLRGDGGIRSLRLVVE